MNEIIIKKAAEALRQRLGENAVRYLAKRMGCDVEHIEQSYIYGVDAHEFARLAKLRAGTAEEFAIALANVEDAQWYRDARAPLPDDLKVLTLEYQYLKEPDDDDFERLFEALGLCSRHEPGEITRFGKVDRTRLRVDAVMQASDRHDPGSTFDFAQRSGLALAHYDIINSFAHRYEVGDEFMDLSWFEVVGFNRFTGPPQFNVDSERAGEFERWARATAKHAERWLALHTACNGHMQEMLKVLEQQEPMGVQEFVVEGLIPRGVVTLLLARKGVGKTNALLELAVAVAERRATWWQFALKPRDGFVVFLLGEGSLEEAEERVRAMNGGDKPLLLKLLKFNDNTMIENIIADLKKSGIKVDLLIVDPARKYYRGDEDGSDAVSDFFTKAEAFADQTKAGLVVSHHLKREAKPHSIHEVPFWVRGSQVWLDRPRVILAMHRQNGVTTFGIPAPNDGDPLHNLKASAMFAGVRRLRRDEDTFTHIDAATPSRKAASKQADEHDALVLAAITRLIGEGKRVSSSDKHELFSFKPKKQSGTETWELDGMTRTMVRAEVQRLIDDGRLLRDVSGMLHLLQK